MLNKNIFWYDSATALEKDIINYIEPVDTVLDIGCGIVPMNYFRPSLHIMMEPYKEYVDILLHRHAEDKSILVFTGKAQKNLPIFTNNSVDSIFILDVIEHFKKEEGFILLDHAERIARKQIVVFTPLGFMPQHAEKNEADGWGLSGTSFQEHLSGWLPEDFHGDWKFYICETYHTCDFRQQSLKEPYGAMFAIKTFTDKPLGKPGKLVNIRKPLPSEIALEQVRQELTQTQNELTQTQAELAHAQRILNHPLIRAQRKIWKIIKLRH